MSNFSEATAHGPGKPDFSPEQHADSAATSLLDNPELFGEPARPRRIRTALWISGVCALAIGLGLARWITAQTSTDDSLDVIASSMSARSGAAPAPTALVPTPDGARIIDHGGAPLPPLVPARQVPVAEQALPPLVLVKQAPAPQTDELSRALDGAALPAPAARQASPPRTAIVPLKPVRVAAAPAKAARVAVNEVKKTRTPAAKSAAIQVSKGKRLAKAEPVPARRAKPLAGKAKRDKDVVLLAAMVNHSKNKSTKAKGRQLAAKPCKLMSGDKASKCTTASRARAQAGGS
jgi:hypothetical protein